MLRGRIGSWVVITIRSLEENEGAQTPKWGTLVTPSALLRRLGMITEWCPYFDQEWFRIGREIAESKGVIDEVIG